MEKQEEREIISIPPEVAIKLMDPDKAKQLLHYQQLKNRKLTELIEKFKLELKTFYGKLAKEMQEDFESL
jgi:hypothetical protein